MKQTKTTKKGRRPLYKSPEQLQIAVDKYFQGCEGTPIYYKNGLPVTLRNGRQYCAGEKPPTISGLSLFLGFKNRQQFTRQKARDAAFRDVVLEACLRIENYWEQALFDAHKCEGAMFMLSMCFGWRKPGRVKEKKAATQLIIRESGEGAR